MLDSIRTGLGLLGIVLLSLAAVAYALIVLLAPVLLVSSTLRG